MTPPPGGWVDYHWDVCPTCGAEVDAWCRDMRRKDRREMPVTIHRARPAFAVHRETGERRR